jgi:NADPH:quinone reductase-like Zn-dependent oxidoreductase
VRKSHPGGIDAVADMVGGDIVDRAPQFVREGGRAASIIVNAAPDSLAERSISFRYVFVRPDGKTLEAIGALIDSDDVNVYLQETMPLAEAARALEQIETGHTRGKIVLTV